MSYLKYYKKHIDKGSISGEGGLCWSFGRRKLFRLVEPTESDFEDLRNEHMPRGHWAAYTWAGNIQTDFTPLRQNIVLLLAALNDEL
jgi:hypothetical protein